LKEACFKVFRETYLRVVEASVLKRGVNPVCDEGFEEACGPQETWV